MPSEGALKEAGVTYYLSCPCSGGHRTLLQPEISAAATSHRSHSAKTTCIVLTVFPWHSVWEGLRGTYSWRQAILLFKGGTGTKRFQLLLLTNALAQIYVFCYSMEKSRDIRGWYFATCSRRCLEELYMLYTLEGFPKSITSETRRHCCYGRRVVSWLSSYRSTELSGVGLLLHMGLGKP